MTTQQVQTAKGQRYTFATDSPQVAIQMATREIRESGKRDSVVSVTTKR